MIDLLEKRRTEIKITLDSIAIIFSGIIANLVIFDKISSGKRVIVLAYLVSYLLISALLKDIAVSWSYTDSQDVLKIIVINIVSGIVSLVFLLFSSVTNFGFIFLLIVFSIGSQLLMRMIFRLRRKEDYKQKGGTDRLNCLVFGAGEAGNLLLRESRSNKNFEYKICGFIDDDIKKNNVRINGIKVYGGKEKLVETIKDLEIETVIIAIPSLSKEEFNKIYKLIENVKDIEIKMLPLVSDLLLTENLGKQLKKVEIEDLLGREEQHFDDTSLKEFIGGKTVLITGGGGSIGSEISRQIAKYSPKKLVNLDVNENTLYLLELELKRIHPELDIESEIASVRDKKKLEETFSKYRPEIVFHAAAHKHVPLMEHNPEEAIKNNIFGTKNLVDTVDKFGVERFVMISTDKAVNPTNIMGASKRACELIVEDKNKISKTKFMAVRFGNVLGSNGSVIPIFRKLIEEGKNLTVTHADMKRYFMTIPEASRLVIEAGRLGKGGELFILDMGEPVKIMDLARNMIKLSGADVGIDVTGLRPGEKLYEELMYDTNSAIKTENNKIFITRMTDTDIDIMYNLDKLKDVLVESKKEEIKKVMKEFVITYKEVEYV